VSHAKSPGDLLLIVAGVALEIFSVAPRRHKRIAHPDIKLGRLPPFNTGLLSWQAAACGLCTCWHRRYAASKVRLCPTTNRGVRLASAPIGLWLRQHNSTPRCKRSLLQLALVLGSSTAIQFPPPYEWIVTGGVVCRRARLLGHTVFF
jgi:hypothetical protein